MGVPQMDDYGVLTKLLSGAVTLLVGGVSYLIKIIFVNNRKIAILETRIENDIERQKDMQSRQKEMLSEMKELRGEIRQIHFFFHKD